MKSLRAVRCVLIAAMWLPVGTSPPAGAQGRAEPLQTLRVWGDGAMASVVEAWERSFTKLHPEVRFENRLMGTDSAMPGLYNGLADMALFGRESDQTENDGFLHTLQYPAFRLLLMNGSLNIPEKSYAPVLFVSASNPLRKLTLGQVDAAFGCGQATQGAPARTWGDLGATGEWKDKPIHIFAIDIDSGSGTFFLRKLQGESKKLNWAIIREFSDQHQPDGSTYSAGQQTMDALKGDPLGLAVSGLQFATGEVRALALAAKESGDYVAASRASVMDGSYPLARQTYVFLNRRPGEAVTPLVRAFLEFAYSAEGRRIVQALGGFLPLSEQDAFRQLALLR